MDMLFHNASKFKNLCPASQNDNKAKNESQSKLLELKKKNPIPVRVCKANQLTGSYHPCVYGLPKIYKKDVPLCPILHLFPTH